MNSNPFDLTGKVAIVTGASRGLGQIFSRALARAGADLVITSREAAALKLFQAEIESLGRRVLPLALNVRDHDSIRKAVEAAVTHFGKIDVLVNNAGCNVRKPALDVTWDDWNLILDTNLRGTFFVAQAVARHMVAKKYGRIINIGSVTCVSGNAGLGPYGASRGGIKQLTMSLADDWGVHGITVNCLAPGWFKTQQNAKLYEEPEWVEYLCDRIPLKRPGQPPDLDGAVVFLASDASAYVTGQTLLVDGGISTGATLGLAEEEVGKVILIVENGFPAALIVGLVILACVNLVARSRFLNSLKLKDPGQWERLGKPGVLAATVTSALALRKYLRNGDYKNLNDERFNRMALVCRISGIVYLSYFGLIVIVMVWWSSHYQR